MKNFTLFCFVLVLSILILSGLASCSKKYGCYYSLQTDSSNNKIECLSYDACNVQIMKAGNISTGSSDSHNITDNNILMVQ